jgi:hypothetical protein
MSDLRDGDIGLVRLADHAGLLGWLMRLGMRLGLIRAQQYEHAFLVYRVFTETPIGYRPFEWRVIEAAWPRVREVPLGDRWQYCDFYRVKDADGLRWAAAWFALYQVGKPYGLGALLWLAWHVFWDRIRGRMTVAEAFICTELVVTSWRKAGVDILPGVPARQVMPDMIAASPWVEKVTLREF